MICWFEAGVTDSFGPQLEGMRDGLGFLPGSACPHYDGEERRRPVYQELVANGFPPGSRPTTPPRSITSAPSCREVVAARDGARALPRRARTPRRRSSRGSSKKSRGRSLKEAAPSPVTSVELVEALPTS